MITQEERTRYIKQSQEAIRRIALRIAQKAYAQNLLDDLISAGNIGLLKALDHFDPTLGFCLATYAGQWIKEPMFALLREEIQEPPKQTPPQFMSNPGDSNQGNDRDNSDFLPEIEDTAKEYDVKRERGSLSITQISWLLRCNRKQAREWFAQVL